MAKIAYLFAGQGAQYVGMGQDLYEQYVSSRDVFDKANQCIDIDLKELCFSGTKEELDKTENTQPAVVTTSLAAYAALKEHGIVPSVTAGLSLGEYCALTASGAFTLEQVVPLVKKRGRFMQEAVPVGVGKMVAVLALSEDKVEQACMEARSAGYVAPANYNCPGQIVIGGEAMAVDVASQKAKELGAFKVVELSLSAPFHTVLLEPASRKLQMELEKVSLGTLEIPVITNVTADYVKEVSKIKELLTKQVMNPVLWEQTIRRMISDGVDTFIEIGPGKTLSGFVKKIDRKLTVCNVQDVASLNKTIECVKSREA